MSINRAIAERFAGQFTPVLRVVKTDAVNGVPTTDCWNISYWDDARKVGIVAHAMRGQLKAYIEYAGPGSIAEDAGKVMASALGMLKGDGTAT